MAKMDNKNSVLREKIPSTVSRKTKNLKTDFTAKESSEFQREI